MTTPAVPLAPREETGTLGVLHLKRLWSRALALRSGWMPIDLEEDQRDRLVLDALGLGLEQAKRRLIDGAPDFAEFERWIVATAGAPAPELVARLNAALRGEAPPDATRAWLAEIDALPPVLDAAALAHWEEHGYVVVLDAVPADACRAAEQAVWAHEQARPEEPATWYGERGQGIMSQMFQHPAFTANRHAPRVHKAFAQLWGTADLWPTCDRAGFNPPLRAGEQFRATDLHWDVSLACPMPFGTQGVLYLADTPPEMGAFRCVPGFHRGLEAWLASLPADANPREQDLYRYGVRHVGARAGSLVIWNDKLPHGASPNRGALPRIVQYLNMYPAQRALNPVWI